MTMPRNLVLVRHGESEGNVAVKMSKGGDHSAFTDDFMERHSSQWRLTDLGVEQARQAGVWIRENIGEEFGRYYTSEYERAKETAALLGLPEAIWYRTYSLRERNWGDLDVLSEQMKKIRFAEALRRRQSDGLYWTPPNGESHADLCSRLNDILGTLHRECTDMNVIIVCHGEVIRAFRFLLERWTPRQFAEKDSSRNPKDKIHNCQIVHYTRVNPETGEEFSYLNWVRSVSPTDLSLSSNEWEAVLRPKFTNEDLIAEVNLTPRLIN